MVGSGVVYHAVIAFAILATKTIDCTFVSAYHNTSLESQHGALSTSQKSANSTHPLPQIQDLNVTPLLHYGMKWGNKKPTKKLHTIPLRHATDSRWGMVGGIRVGSQKTPYEVMFDTESSNVLMFHEDITDSNDGLFDYEKLFNKNNQFYDPAASTPADFNDKEFEIRYPDGSVYGGGRATDDVWVLNGSKERMGFAWVDYMNTAAEKNRGGDFDGIVGLGAQELLHGRHMDALLVKLVGGNDGKKKMKKHHPLLEKNPVFAFYVSKTGKTGALTLGGHNNQHLAKGKVMSYYSALYLTSWDSDDDDENFVSSSDSRDSSETRGSDIIEDPDGILRASVVLSYDVATSLVWGITVQQLLFGDAPVDESNIHMLFSSTLPYGVAVSDRKYLEQFSLKIGNGAEVTEKGELVIPCDNLKSGNQLPDLRFTLEDENHKDAPLSFSPPRILPSSLPERKEG